MDPLFALRYKIFMIKIQKQKAPDHGEDHCIFWSIWIRKG